MESKLEPSFSALLLSIGSSAAMSMGLAPNPATGETEKDKEMAKFHIEMLRILKQKTQNNLTEDEKKFLDNLLSDLQLKFVSC